MAMKVCPTCGGAVRDHERDRAMLEMRQAGLTLQQIADRWGVSPSRVRSILLRLTPHIAPQEPGEGRNQRPLSRSGHEVSEDLGHQLEQPEGDVRDDGERA